MDNYNLRDGKQPFGLGLKEVWVFRRKVPGWIRVPHARLQSSPMDKVFGWCSLYHQEPDLVLTGCGFGFTPTLHDIQN
jgi:hypothetical protein